MVKSPSKYLSLEKLKRIQKDNYKSDNGFEYCAEEVDLLIKSKQTQRADKIWLARQKVDRNYSTDTDNYIGFYL